jgi:hypothetical protein
MPLVSKTFDQLLDFTRTTAATFVGSNGLIQTTPASVNLLLQTQQFDNAAWGKDRITVTANSTTAPDGTSTAESVVATAVLGTHGFGTAPSVTITSGVTYVASVYAKAAGYNFLRLRIFPGSGNLDTYFNLATGAVATVAAGVTASIQDAGNGWYRCVCVFTAAATATNSIFVFQPHIASADGVTSFTGDGTSGIFIWGAQLEAVPDANLALGSELNVASVPFTVFRDVSTSTASPTLVNTVIGKAYRLQLNISTNTSTGSSALRIGGGPISASGGVPAGFTGNLILYFVAASAGALTIVGDGPGVNFTVTSVSVKEITGTVGMPSTYTRNNGGRFPPRFDYDPVTLAPKGILIEEQRVNLLTYSEDFSDVSWVKVGAGTASAPVVTADYATAPNGTMTADRVVLTLNGGITPSDYSALQKNIGSGTQSTSVWLKTTDGSTVSVALRNATFSVLTVTGVWQRFTLENQASTNNFQLILRGTYGTSDSADILVWGAQLEAGAFATSYIPTVASTVTRTADFTNIVAPNFASWYNQSEGTFVVEVSPTGFVAGGNTRFLEANDGTANNRKPLFFANNTAGVSSQIRVGGVDQALLSSAATGIFAPNVILRAATAYATNDFAASYNGAAAVTDASGSVGSTATRLDIGYATSAGAGNEMLNGHIRSIRYFPTRLSNAQLQALTV